MKIKVFIYNLFVALNLHKGIFHQLEEQLLHDYYNTNDIKKDNKIIFMVDGRSIHGGLADRIKGMISIYYLCKKYHRNFKINFTYPFNLTDYLIPNKYNWKIEKDDICYNKKYALPILINDFQLPANFHEFYFFKKILSNKQLHIYSDSPIAWDNFSNLFNELFKPSERLQSDIDKITNDIGQAYISATFRFQALLGDFDEGPKYPQLDKTEREPLIQKCILEIEKLHKKNKNLKILVTSDSITFLNRVNEKEYVYTIPGNIVHMDYTEGESFGIYEKSFLDFYMIAYAKESYLFQTGKMYRSGFAKVASKVNNHPYFEIIF